MENDADIGVDSASELLTPASLVSAPLWWRALSLAGDLAMIQIALLVPSAILAPVWMNLDIGRWFGPSVWMCAWIASQMWLVRGATFGMRGAALRAIDLRTARTPRWGRSLVRALVPLPFLLPALVTARPMAREEGFSWGGEGASTAWLVALLVVVYGPALLSKDRRGLQDRLSGIRIVKAATA